MSRVRGLVCTCGSFLFIDVVSGPVSISVLVWARLPLPPPFPLTIPFAAPSRWGRQVMLWRLVRGVSGGAESLPGSLTVMAGCVFRSDLS